MKMIGGFFQKITKIMTLKQQVNEPNKSKEFTIKIREDG